MIFLQDNIKEVLDNLPKEVKDVVFDLNLYPDLSISDTKTGIRIKFSVKRK